MLRDKTIASKAFQPYLSKFLHVYARAYQEGELPNEFTISGGQGRKISYEHTITFTSSDE